MKFYTPLITSIIILAAPTGSAALSIVNTNLVDFDSSTAAIVDNTGTAIAQNTGVISVGSFGSLTDSQIQSLSSTSIISSSFDAIGSGIFNIGDGLFQNNISDDGDTTRFAGQNIFTVIGNGDTIADSTQVLIYKHTELNGTGQFVILPNQNENSIVAAGDASTGELLVGVYDAFTHDFGVGEVSAYSLVAVPEPSSSALLAIAGVGFILRRRR